MNQSQAFHRAYEQVIGVPTDPDQMIGAAPKNTETFGPQVRSREQWMVLIAAFLGWMFDGVEQGAFPLVARPALQDLLGLEADKAIGPWMGYITALFLIG